MASVPATLDGCGITSWASNSASRSRTAWYTCGHATAETRCIYDRPILILLRGGRLKRLCLCLDSVARFYCTAFLIGGACVEQPLRPLNLKLRQRESDVGVGLRQQWEVEEPLWYLPGCACATGRADLKNSLPWPRILNTPKPRIVNAPYIREPMYRGYICCWGVGGLVLGGSDFQSKLLKPLKPVDFFLAPLMLAHGQVEGSGVHMWTCDETISNQKWHFVPAGTERSCP